VPLPPSAGKPLFQEGPDQVQRVAGRYTCLSVTRLPGDTECLGDALNVRNAFAWRLAGTLAQGPAWKPLTSNQKKTSVHGLKTSQLIGRR
jgi:hypothetical protein